MNTHGSRCFTPETRGAEAGWAHIACISYCCPDNVDDVQDPGQLTKISKRRTSLPTPLRLHVGDLQTYVTIMAGRCPELQGMALFASRVAAREEASQALQLALACS